MGKKLTLKLKKPSKRLESVKADLKPEPVKKKNKRTPSKMWPSNNYLFEFEPFSEFKPLAIGCHVYAIENKPDGISDEEVRLSLFMHARKLKYLRAIIAGGNRYNLDGSINGVVTEAESKHAKGLFNYKRAKKGHRQLK